MHCGECVDFSKLIGAVLFASTNPSWEGTMRYPDTSSTGETKEWCEGQLYKMRPPDLKGALAALSCSPTLSSLLLGVLGLIGSINVSR